MGRCDRLVVVGVVLLGVPCCEWRLGRQSEPRSVGSAWGLNPEAECALPTPFFDGQLV